MKKVLIFGSSHIGAIKNGLELYKLDRTPSLDFSFLGFSQPRFKRSFVVKDGEIRATKQEISRTVQRLFGDLPLNFHPAAFRVSACCMPGWAG